jgi:hypothetical protein
LTFVLSLLYRPLTPEAEPAVVLAPHPERDPAPEHVGLPKEIT